MSSKTAATVLDGRAIAAGVRDAVAADVRGFASRFGTAPALATILVGDDPASAVYVAMKRKACSEVGIESFHHHLPADAPREELLDLVERLNEDPVVSGILCQLPLPAHLDANEITQRVSPAKDVDGLTVANAGRLALGLPGLRPCTPLGVTLLLDEAGVNLRGKTAVVIGRSNLFGKPMAQMLLAADATVTNAHSRTLGLADVCREADVVIAAVGRPELIRGDWIKPGAVVIDVGINRTHEGLVGDVAFAEAAAVASVITPVPGGAGPMTIACLLRNTVDAAAAAAGLTPVSP